MAVNTRLRPSRVIALDLDGVAKEVEDPWFTASNLVRQVFRLPPYTRTQWHKLGEANQWAERIADAIDEELRKDTDRINVPGTTHKIFRSLEEACVNAFKAGGFNPAFIALCKEARSRGYGVVAVTNGSHEWIKAVGYDQLKDDGFVDEIIVSSEQGQRKPLIEAWQTAAEYYGVKLASMVAIDDTPENLDCLVGKCPTVLATSKMTPNRKAAPYSVVTRAECLSIKTIATALHSFHSGIATASGALGIQGYG